MHGTSVVIPFYNGDDYIDACLRSLSQGSCAQADKIIVNNSDRATRVHSIAAAYGNVTVLDTKPRLGFGRACNAGARIAIKRGSSYIVVLNQDSLAHQNLIAELIRPFDLSDRLAITAPVLYSHDFSSLEGWYISEYLSRCPELYYDALNRRIGTRYKLDRLCGACFAIRSDLVARFGLFDPVYFMYYEDDDLCRRINRLNYEIALIPSAMVAHVNQAGNPDKKRDIPGMFRYSAAIYDLKDTDSPLLRALLGVLYRNAKYYPWQVLSLRIASVLRLLISDMKLLTGLPRIVRSRSVEKRLLAGRLPNNEGGSSGRPQ